MLLLGNSGHLLETRTTFCHQKKGRRMRKGAIKRCEQQLTGILREAQRNADQNTRKTTSEVGGVMERQIEVPVWRAK